MTSAGERFGEHLGYGLTLLWRSGRIAGVRRWLGEGTNWLDTAVRWLMVGAPAALVSWWLLGAWWRVITAAVVVLVLAARAATKDVKAKQASAEKPAPASAATADGPDHSPEDVPAAELVALAHHLLDGAPGVHLATLAGALGGGHTTATVRALCAAHGIPVRPSVRDASRRVSPGVHRADLPPLPEPLPDAAKSPDVAVVAAGQPATTTPATPPTTPAPTTPTTPTVTVHGGVRVTAVDDPDNPARTHVTVVDTTTKRTKERA